MINFNGRQEDDSNAFYCITIAMNLLFAICYLQIFQLVWGKYNKQFKTF